MVETRSVGEPFIRINGILEVTYLSIAGFSSNLLKKWKTHSKGFILSTEYGLYFKDYHGNVNSYVTLNWTID